MKIKTYVLFGCIGAVLLAYTAFIYYVKNINIETFSTPTISSELYNNESVIKSYHDCFVLQNSITNLELQKCKLRASKSWFTQSLEEANCNLSQARAVEIACKSIIAPYLKKP